MEFLDIIDPAKSNTDEHWVFRRPKWYETNRPKWLTAWTHYEADFSVLRTKEHLIRRIQGESEKQFKERLDTADYLPLFGTAVDSIVGRMLSAEPVVREFGQEGARRSLGRTDRTGDIAYDLWRDIDGKGTNYLTMMEDLAIRLTVFNEMWVYVRGPETEGGAATVELFEPISVVNAVFDKHGNPIDVLVLSNEDTRTSIEDPIGESEVYWRFMLDGFQRIVVIRDKNGNKLAKEEEVEPYFETGNSYWKSAKRKKKTLPIFRVELPLRRKVGYILAEKNKVLFNQESERDNILRIACTPLFVYVGTNPQFKQAEEDRKKGSNALQLDPQSARQHYYAAPPSDPADLRTRVLRDKIGDFFVSAFRFYEDSIRGKQKTATEIGQDAASGEGSFLNSLGNSLDEAENRLALRLEQAYFSSTPEVWGQFRVERPRKYESVSPREEADKLAELLFGKYPVPVGNTGRINAIKMIAQGRRFQVDEEELEDDVERWATAIEPEVEPEPESIPEPVAFE